MLPSSGIRNISTFQRPDFFYLCEDVFNPSTNGRCEKQQRGPVHHHEGELAPADIPCKSKNDGCHKSPVFDYQKVPATTVMQKPEMPSEREIQKLGQTDFAGAVTDGRYGAAAFDFKSPHDPLCARKSWFFFDKEYVCLGSAISCDKELPVATTLNQCLLRDDVTIFSKNSKSIIERGEAEFEYVDWIFQDGRQATYSRSHQQLILKTTKPQVRGI